MSLLPTRHVDKAIAELREYDVVKKDYQLVKQELSATQDLLQSHQTKTAEQQKAIDLQNELIASSRKESETWISIADNYKLLYEDERKIRKRDRRLGAIALGGLAVLIVLK